MFVSGLLASEEQARGCPQVSLCPSRRLRTVCVKSIPWDSTGRRPCPLPHVTPRVFGLQRGHKCPLLGIHAAPKRAD